MRLPLLLALGLLPLSACSTVQEAMKGPELAPVGYPATLAPMQQVVIDQQDAPPPASANSLWRAGSRAFFIDQRARKIGDILTVLIEIDDSAKTRNTSTSQRASTMNAAVPSLLGLEGKIGRFLPPHNNFDPTNALSTKTGSTNSGTGSVNRAEKISLTIAAVVSAVLPNGNLVIQGTQEVRTNAELRQLTVAGIVRPEDISSSNTIKNSQIAEARISYGGRGDISRVQKVPGMQSVVERFQPF